MSRKSHRQVNFPRTKSSKGKQGAGVSGRRPFPKTRRLIASVIEELEERKLFNTVTLSVSANDVQIGGGVTLFATTQQPVVGNQTITVGGVMSLFYPDMNAGIPAGKVIPNITDDAPSPILYDVNGVYNASNSAVITIPDGQTSGSINIGTTNDEVSRVRQTAAFSIAGTSSGVTAGAGTSFQVQDENPGAGGNANLPDSEMLFLRKLWATMYPSLSPTDWFAKSNQPNPVGNLTFAGLTADQGHVVVLNLILSSPLDPSVRFPSGISALPDLTSFDFRNAYVYGDVSQYAEMETLTQLTRLRLENDTPATVIDPTNYVGNLTGNLIDAFDPTLMPTLGIVNTAGNALTGPLPLSPNTTAIVTRYENNLFNYIPPQWTSFNRNISENNFAVFPASTANPSSSNLTQPNLSNLETPSLVVNTLSDTVNPYDGLTSLPEAVSYADALGGGTITFAPNLAGGTINLTGQQDNTFGNSALWVYGNVKIVAPAGGITISGPGASQSLRAFYVGASKASLGVLDPSLTLQNVTVSNFDAIGGTGTGGGGGGAGLGGAILNNGGSVSLINSTLNNDEAIGGSATAYTGGDAYGGGGGFSGAGGNGNADYGSGGGGGGTLAGIDAWAASGGVGGSGYPGQIAGSGSSQGANFIGGQGLTGGGGAGPDGAGGSGAFGGGGGGGAAGGGNGGFGGGGGGGSTGGTGGFGGGGGIDAAGGWDAGAGNGTTGGGGAGLGGAIFNYGGTVTLQNSTLTDDAAVGGTGATNGSGIGGAVFNFNGTVNSTFATIARNTADNAGAIYSLGLNGSGITNVQSYSNNEPTDPTGLDGTAASVGISDSILSNSVNAGSAAVADFVQSTLNGGSATSGGTNNIIQSATAFAGTALAVDPKLGTLAGNGGDADSLALLSGSPAIGAGVAVNGITADQRGATRLATPSIGAFEYTPPVVTAGGTVNYSLSGSPIFTDPGLTVSDASNSTLVSATVTIGTGFAAGDLLAASTQGTAITAEYIGATGILTLSGTDTLANYQTVLESISFSSSSSFVEARTISYSVSDGTFSSNTGTSTVTVTATPTITNAAQPTVVAVGASIADQATVTGEASPTGTVTFNLYNNATDTGPALFTDTESLASGTATSANYIPTAVGTDYWVATYNGDGSNNSVSTGDADASVLVGSLVVDNTGDGSTGNTLRDAVAYAEAMGGNQTITFASNIQGGTISPLAIGALNLGPSAFAITGSGTDITIDGGAGGITLNGSASSVALRAFYIGSGATLNLDHFTVSNFNVNAQQNSSAIEVGGAIYVAAGSTLSLSDDTLADNAAFEQGGAIDNRGTASITNSTLSGNSTTVGEGGAIFNGGTLTAEDDTISGNASAHGGGIAVGSVSVSLANTIVAGNTATNSDPDIDGTVTSLGNNLIGDGTGSTGLTNGSNGDQVGTGASPINPLLAPLGNYGGPTQTMPLLPGSPAIGAAGPIDAVEEIQISPPSPSNATTAFVGMTFVNSSTTTMPAYYLANDNYSSTIQSDLDALSAIGGVGGSVTVVSPESGVYLITFEGTLANSVQPLISLNLSGGASGSVSTTVVGFPGGSTDQTGYARSATTPSIGAYENEGFTLTADPTAATQSATTSAQFTDPLKVTVDSNNALLTDLAGGVITYSAPTDTTQPTAILSRTTATIAADNTASVTAAADSVAGGPYTVAASASGVATAADFSLTNNAAGSLIVNTTGDPASPIIGENSLREAIAYANTLGGDQTITFADNVTGTITLGGTALELNDSTGTITIDGPGAGVLSVSGNNASGVFQVDSGTTAEIDGLTITQGSDAQGGGIKSNGSLTLNGDNIIGNAATTDGGGGVFAAGPLTVIDSAIANNTALNNVGGGIQVASQPSTTLISIINTTIAGNSVGDVNTGGAFWINGGTAVLTNDTIVGNTGVDGVYISMHVGQGTFTINNSIAVGNYINDVGAVDNNVSANYCLFGSVSLNPDAQTNDLDNISTGDLFGGNALGVYGAPNGVQTLPLVPGSIAIDAGSNALAVDQNGVPLATDARGQTRVVNGTVDIGAFESGGYTIAPVSGSGQTAEAANPFTNPLVVKVTANNPGDPVAGGSVTLTGPVTGPGIKQSSATIASDGTASIIATTNGTVGGPYTVDATSSDVPSPAIFQLTTGPQSLVVNTNQDVVANDGKTSLREAIAYADAIGGGTITFAQSLKGETITLDGSALVLSSTANPVIIDASGISGVTISGNNASGVFNVDYGATVTMNDLTITGGKSGRFGGGIDDDGTLSVINSTIADNSSTGEGGGIFNSGTLTVTGSMLYGNSSREGGGIADDNAVVSVAVINSTLTDNTAVSLGGGIFFNLLDYGSLTIANSTVVGNTSSEAADVYSSAVSNTVDNSIISDFEAYYGLNISNSLFGPFSANTLSDNGTSGVTNGVNGNIIVNSIAALGLGTLGNYGGPTETIPLLPASPAIGAGATANYPGTTTPITTDQTGYTRSLTAPSIGAYENEGFTITAAGGTPQSTAISSPFATALGVKVTSNNALLTDLAGAVIAFTAPGTGASATFGTNPITLIANGTGSATATANSTGGGPYTVSATASGISNSATFSLTNVAANDSISGTDYLVSNTTTTGSLTTSSSGLPVAGTTVTLTGRDALGNAVSETTTTNSSGQYSFTGLNPSNASGYTITEMPPATDSHLGQTSTTGGAVATTSGVVSNIVLDSGGTSTDNFFETASTSVSGSDYLVPSTTTAASLTTSTTGTPIAGTTITVTGTDAFGNAVSKSTTTAASGQFTFSGLNPSNGSGYTVTETIPGADTHIGQTSTTASAVTTPATTATVSTIALTTGGASSTDNFFDTVVQAAVGQLNGTPSANTTASYGNLGNTYANVFDGNTNTYFDAPTPNGNWVQLDLGAAQSITRIQYAPRVSFESRMVGGIFEASNDPTFATGVVTLFTVTATPADGLNSQAVSVNGTYRYVRYVSPAGSYGNIAELQVFGPGGVVAGPAPVQLKGTTSANTTGSYDGKTSDNYTAAFDGNINTFFDAPTANGNWIQIDLGSSQPITQIAYAARPGFQSRMIGGIFEASNDPTFSTGVAMLYTITTQPSDGLITQPVTGTYRYVRYVSPAGSYGNIAEMQVFGPGTSTTTAPVAPGTPTLSSSTSTTATIAWTASPSVGVTGYIVLRNGVQIGTTDSTTFTYSDSGLSPSTGYSYTIEAADGTVDSLPSGALTITTPAAPPLPPSAPTLVSDTSTTAAIAWTASTSAGITGYIVLRNDVQVGTPNSTTFTFSDYPLNPLTSYTYTVEAVAGALTSVPSASLSIITPPASSNKLTGTVIGTTGSYDGKSTDAAAAALDGNLNTFFDAPTAGTAGSPNWVGLNLGSTYNITAIEFAPRVGFESRMVGGEFQVSNNASFSNTNGGIVDTLDTITSTPADGYTTLTIPSASSPGAFEYVRYLAPAGSYGNIAEIAVFGTAGTTKPVSAQLTGTASANTAASYDGKPSDNYTAAFDGNSNTFFDAPTANGNYVQLDLGTARTITQIAYAPRVSFESRMVGGYFEASNDPTFGTGVTVLYTITSPPADGLTTQAISVTGTFRYVRYVAPTGSYGNIAEMQLFGY